ncbi:hypothetical protein Tco_0559259 [Tanacetum coccineum]
MASFDHRLNPLFSIKECLSCCDLYTRNCGCSKGSFEDKILVPVPDSSQRPPQNYATCGDLVDGLYCRPCAFVRKCLNEGWYTIHDENKILNTSESPNHNTNVVSAPREPFVVNQDPGENSSQSPPHIDHNCCYECGDSLDDIFCQRCTCKSCGKGAHYGYNCPTQIPIISNPEPCYNQNLNEILQNLQSLQQKCLLEGRRKADCGRSSAKDQYWKIPICYDDDDDKESSIPLKDIITFRCPSYVAVTPVLSTEEPVDSLIMKDEHLDTILTTESDEVIKSSVKNLVQIPRESKGISDGGCDVPLCDNPTPLEAFKEHSETIIDSNNDPTSSDDDYPYGEDINYVDASPPDAEIVSLEVLEIVIPEVGGVDTDILLTIKDNILRENLLNVNLLIANIEALKDNPTSSSNFVTKSSSTSLNLFLEETNTFDNSLPETETFRFNLEEISSGSTTTRSDYSLPDYEAFYLNDDHIEEKSSGSTTTHADFSLPKYDSFIFDLSINPFPPADRSDFYHEEFADELAHIISPPDLECFYFKIEPDPGDLIDPGIRENVSSTTNVNLPFEDAQSPLLAFVVWIFLAFLTYPITPPYLLSTGSEDTIFDPGIST